MHPAFVKVCQKAAFFHRTGIDISKYQPTLIGRKDIKKQTMAEQIANKFGSSATADLTDCTENEPWHTVPCLIVRNCHQTKPGFEKKPKIAYL